MSKCEKHVIISRREEEVEMENLKIGDKFVIHCYKHDGNIHRTWDEAVLLEIHDDYLIFGNNRTKVIEADGRTWRTKEPAVMYFFKKQWFNIIGQYKDTGIYYYCNIASPYIIEEKTIKYIDYDLDLRVFPDGSFKVLDRGEYRYHKNLMHYSEELDRILKSELTDLIELARRKGGPFERGTVEKYCAYYQELVSKYRVWNHNE